MKPFRGHASVLGALGIAGFVMVAAAGCSGSDATEPNTPARAGAGVDAALGGAGTGGNAGDRGSGEIAGRAGEGGEAGAIELPAPWDEHGRHIELDCFGYFDGSMRFSADRAQLRARELELLSRLRQTRADDTCAEDQRRCRVAITSGEGDVVEFVADELNALCDKTGPAIAYDSLAPFLNEISCKFAREDSARPLSASEGCIHGMHADEPPSETRQPLDLADAKRPYHVEVELCPTAEATVELLGTDPSVPLAVGIPLDRGARSKVIALDVEVEQPIIADLVITTTATCSSWGGDFELTFRALQ